MRKLAKPALTVSLILAGAGIATAMAAEAEKPAAPSLSDVLTSSGLTATGYVDGTYSYNSVSSTGSTSTDSNTFGLNQASLTLGYTPMAGFGAVVQAVAGTEAGNGCYAPGYLPCGSAGSTSSFNILQAYAQYISGQTTLYVGKFTTLAGAEVAAPTGNTNVSRSLLFWYSEPVTHVGARLAYAASDQATLTIGVNNGWNNDSSSSAKTLELGAALTPDKTFTLGLFGYYSGADSTVGGAKTLIDVVATWTATPSLTVIATADFNSQDKAATLSVKPINANWYGVALYLNYAIDDQWRVSARAEYLDDAKSYATTGLATNKAVKVNEGTLTFGYAPAKPFEFRFEGRYDTIKPDVGAKTNTTQAWLQALYKF